MPLPQKIGRYEIVEEVGRGAMGAVYKARDPNIGRIVAIKTILSSVLTGPLADEYRKRFQREARAAGILAHPGIVTVYDVDEDAGTAFLVMEFVTGRTLASALDRGERFPFSGIYDLGSQLARALRYAHSHGVVHRDIKPANILLTAPPGGAPDTMVKITDFGVAKLSNSQITTVQQMLGTPAFMSPEQCTGAPLDGRSDLFSLGVILYWMATGDKPFVGETLTALSYKIVHAEPIPPRSLNPGMPQRLEKIILRCLAKSPDARYPTGQEIAAELISLAEPGTLRLRLPEEEERHVRPDDETTPMLGQPLRQSQQPRTEPPRVAPAAPPPDPAVTRRLPSGPAPPQTYRPVVPDPAAQDAATTTHRPATPSPPELHSALPYPEPGEGTRNIEPTAAVPGPEPGRPWYEPESATRMGAAGRPATDESLLRAPNEPLPRQVPPASRNYIPILLAVIGVLVVVLLAVVLWPRRQSLPSPGRPSTAAPTPAPQQLASSQPSTSVPAGSTAGSGASDPAPQDTSPASASSVPGGSRNTTPALRSPQTVVPSQPTDSRAAPVPPVLVGTPTNALPAARVYVPGETQRARLIHGPKPPYPPLARQARVQGTVRMQAVIAKDGTVAHLEAVSGHPLLLDAALDSVRQWRYQPLLQDGEPVEVATTVDLAFTLTTDPAPVHTASAEGRRGATASAPSAAPPPAKSAPAPAKTSSGAAPPASTAAAPPSPSPAPAKSAPAPSTPAKTEPSPGTPAKAAPAGPPSLYSEESKAALRIVALGLPYNVQLAVFMGDEQIHLRFPSARQGVRDVTFDTRVLPGQRTFRVVMTAPGSGAESRKTARGQLQPRGSHTLEIEIRGTADNGLPRFNLKLK
jgi:TonB family protein